MEKLDREQIEAMIKDHPEWTVSGDALQRTLNLDGFADAIDFVNLIAELAEQVGHHPDIMIRFNKVTLSLTTHDAGGLTERDFAFASAADELLAARQR